MRNELARPLTGSAAGGMIRSAMSVGVLIPCVLLLLVFLYLLVMSRRLWRGDRPLKFADELTSVSVLGAVGRAEVRVLPTVAVLGTGIFAMALATGVVGADGGVLAFGFALAYGLAFGLLVPSVLLVNVPRLLVPPDLRDAPGLIGDLRAAWKAEQRETWREAVHPASGSTRGSAGDGADSSSALATSPHQRDFLDHVLALLFLILMGITVGSFFSDPPVSIYLLLALGASGMLGSYSAWRNGLRQTPFRPRRLARLRPRRGSN